MKKAIVGLVVLCLLALSVVAIKPNGPAAVNGLNRKGTQHLELYEKDPVTWEVVEGGASGRLTFSDRFVFNGHGLEPATDYTLIRYEDLWPGNPVCLASGISNNGGNVHLSGEMLDGGSKVWLVLSGDVDCVNREMVGWNPSEYLFEYAELI